LNKDEFFIHEIGCQDTIDVKRAYIDLAGDLVAGVMLSQLVYWHLPQKRTPTAEKLRVFHEGQLWLAKKREDWWTECRITPKQVDRAVSILTGKAALEVNGDTGYPQIPLIEAKLFKFANAPTLHLRVLWENFLPAYEEAARKVAEEMGFEAEGDFTQRVKSEVILPKGENGFYPNGKINLPQTVKSLTKTTTKTIAKTKEERAPHSPDTPTAKARARASEQDEALAPYYTAYWQANGGTEGEPENLTPSTRRTIRPYLLEAKQAGIAAEDLQRLIAWRTSDEQWRPFHVGSDLRTIIGLHQGWVAKGRPQVWSKSNGNQPGRSPSQPVKRHTVPRPHDLPADFDPQKRGFITD